MRGATTSASSATPRRPARSSTRPCRTFRTPSNRCRGSTFKRKPLQPQAPKCYPSKSRSYLLSLGNILFPFYNPAFAIGIGLIYWIVTWEFQTLVSRYEISVGKIDTLGMGTSLWSVLPAMPIYLIQAIITSISLTILLGGLYAILIWYVDAVELPGFRRYATKFVVGTAHFLAHLTAMFTLSLLVVTWNNQMTPTIQSQLDALYTSREEKTPIVRDAIKESLEPLKRRTEQRQRAPLEAPAASPVRQLVGFMSYPILMIVARRPGRRFALGFVLGAHGPVRPHARGGCVRRAQDQELQELPAGSNSSATG